MCLGRLVFFPYTRLTSLGTRFPLGVPFCCQKGTKDHQRRGLPPPFGIHPAVLGVPASSSLRPLARWGHIDGQASEKKLPASLQMVLLLSRASPRRSSCSQLSVDWLPAVATPLFQSRPGLGNHPALRPPRVKGAVTVGDGGIVCPCGWANGTVCDTSSELGNHPAEH